MLNRFARYDYKDMNVLDLLIETVDLQRKYDVLEKLYRLGAEKAFLIVEKKGLIKIIFFAQKKKNFADVVLSTFENHRIYKLCACMNCDDLNIATS